MKVLVKQYFEPDFKSNQQSFIQEVSNLESMPDMIYHKWLSNSGDETGPDLSIVLEDLQINSNDCKFNIYSQSKLRCSVEIEVLN